MMVHSRKSEAAEMGGEAPNSSPEQQRLRKLDLFGGTTIMYLFAINTAGIGQWKKGAEKIEGRRDDCIKMFAVITGK